MRAETFARSSFDEKNVDQCLSRFERLASTSRRRTCGRCCCSVFSGFTRLSAGDDLDLGQGHAAVLEGHQLLEDVGVPDPC